MATNQFFPWAAGVGANALDPVTLAGLPERGLGFQGGSASSAKANAVWRQATTMAAVLGQLITQIGPDSAIDDGNVAPKVTSLLNGIPILSQTAFYAVASGTDTYAAALSPAPITLTTGMQIVVYFANANTTTTPTLNLNNLGQKLLIKQLGGALLPGDVSGYVPLIYDGANWRFNGLAKSSGGRLIAVRLLLYSGSYVPSPGMTFCLVEGVGGGAAGAGAGGASGSGNVSIGAPGTAGCYGRAFYTAAQIGGSQSVTVGSGGIPSSGGPGGNGGTTSLGALLSLPGGVGGGVLTNQVAPTINSNGTTTVGASGTPGANITSQPGSVQAASLALSGLIGIGGQGGSNPLGTGGYGSSVNAAAASGTGYGSGGAGAFVNASGGTIAGGAGTQGEIIIIEFGV